MNVADVLLLVIRVLEKYVNSEMYRIIIATNASKSLNRKNCIAWMMKNYV